MSALVGPGREIGPDGVARYRPRVKVVVHSHNSPNLIDLSKSVITFNSNKNIKSVGQMSFALTGEYNWFNKLYPNDYVNLYEDLGDGQGWTRVFYGFIDHIEQNYQSGGGKPSTVYSVQCSDFQKALERTQIYFNPHVAAREDFRGGFVGTPNLGGLALMTRGIRINGSPADMVLNIILLLMGFGSQFMLPGSYNPRLATRLRQQRAEFILGRVSEDVRNQVLEVGGYAEYLERVRSQVGAEAPIDALTDPESTNASDQLQAERARFSNAVIERLGGGGSGVADETTGAARERGVEAYNILNTTLQGSPPTLLDVIDVFTFVERGAIDGYAIGMPMWEQQGSVMSFLRSISNEVVNELFFDLRPISVGGGLIPGTQFSRDLDDIQGNQAVGGVPAGIQYAPAMIMREYPFSTIHRIDGTDIALTIREQSAPGESPDQRELGKLGMLHFGAIFSNEPNVPGRHTIPMPNINPEDLAQGLSQFTVPKHLDTVVVHDSEIISTRFSRSDTDHFNLFEFYSNALLGEHARFMSQDLLPIMTPIHVARHGLRVRSLTTRFGQFSLDTVNRQQPQPPPPTQAQEEARDIAPTPEPSTPPVVLPIELGSDKGYVTRANQWWYRRKTTNGSRRHNNWPGQPTPPAGIPYWRFHNGVDIRCSRGEPVRAVMDGRVVMAAPVGTKGRAGYGNVVVIYHPSQDLFSVYAHLDTIAEKFQSGSRSKWLSHHCSTDLRANGKYEAVEVRAGEVVGTAGNSDCEGVHLHFEFNKKRGNMAYPSSSDRLQLTPDVYLSGPAPVSGALVSPSRPANPDESQTISQDPVRVFSTLGVTLPVGPSDMVPASPTDPTLVEDTYDGGDGGEEVPEEEHPLAPAGDDTDDDTTPLGSNSALRVGHVDNASLRRQLARWALLNDHWFQHNLEYLSGTVEMRPAPEIRVGYRLDLPDKGLSFYVEGVSHSWTYPTQGRTTLQVTRGQPNNPYPSYVLPHIEGFAPTETQRRTNSRLAHYFVTPDPISVRRALKMDGTTMNTSQRASTSINAVDSPVPADTLSDKYGETIIEASSVFSDADYEEALKAAREAMLEAQGSSTGGTEANPLSGMDDDIVSELFPTLDDL